MQIKIHAPFEVNTLLQDLIDKKVTKLLTFYDRINKVDVFLKIDDPKSSDGKVVEISLRLPGKDAFAQEKSNSFEKAIVAATEKLERQLKKRKEKLKSS